MLESPSRVMCIKWTRVRSRSLMPGPSTSKRRVMGIVEMSEEEFMLTLRPVPVPKKVLMTKEKLEDTE